MVCVLQFYFFIILEVFKILNFSDAEVCPRNYCDTVQCQNPLDCPPGETMTPTACACCLYCVPVIRKFTKQKNDWNNNSSEYILTRTRILAAGGRCIEEFGGAPPNRVCQRGTRCTNGTCQPSWSCQWMRIYLTNIWCNFCNQNTKNVSVYTCSK